MFLVFIPPYAHSLDHNHHRLCLKFRPFLIRPTPAVLPYSHNKSLEVVHPLHSSLVLSSSSSSYFIRSCCCPVPPSCRDINPKLMVVSSSVVCGGSAGLVRRIGCTLSDDSFHSAAHTHTRRDRNRPTDFQLRRRKQKNPCVTARLSLIRKMVPILIN